jgi:Flp pilus assembly protein TadD
MDVDRYKRGLAALALAALSACALPQTRGDDGSVRPPSEMRGGGESADGRSMHMDLVQGMLKQKKYYAALAHVQELQVQNGNTPELRYLEAEARRALGQVKAADALYRGLLRSEYAADAYRGLGLLYASSNLPFAVQQLQQAVQRRPSDARMRNDLGYALMVAGRYQEALPQLATAVELAPEDSQGLNNLVILLLITRDEAGAKKMAAQGDIGPEALDALRRQARQLAARPAK